MEQTRENDSFIDDLEMSSSCAPANVATVVIRPDDGRIAGLITSAPAAKAFSFQFKPQSVAQFKALDRYPHYMHATMAPSLTLAPSDIRLAAKPCQISPPLAAEGQVADLTTLGHSLLQPNIFL